MAVQLDARPHYTVLEAVAAAAVPGGAAFRFDQVPGDSGNPGVLPRLFATVRVSRRPVEAVRNSGTVSRSAWRVVVEGCGRTAFEAEGVLTVVTEALESQAFTIDGRVSTPFWCAASDEADRSSDGYYVATREWEYVV